MTPAAPPPPPRPSGPGPAPVPGPGSAGPARRTSRAVVAGILALVLTAAVVVLLAGPLRDATAERDAYRAAPPCPATSTSNASDASDASDAECMREWPAVVAGTERVTRGRTTHRLLTYTIAGRTHQVRMTGTGPVFDAVARGDRVGVVYWRGEPRTVVFGDLRQDTRAAPTRGPAAVLSIALFLAVLAAAFGWGAYWLAFRSHRSPALSPAQIAVPLGASVILAVFAAIVPQLTESVPVVLASVAAGAVVIGVPSALLVRARTRRGTDSVTVRPRRPRGERCVPVSVRGAVPYSLFGYDHLVIGPDGPVAVSTDPTGRIARWPVPPTLEYLRTRPPYRTDPGPPPRSTDRVVECRDGAVPVLLVADRADVPWIVGSLLRGARPGR
ncbi:hypothetical protein [Streptomyces sp. NPDC005805]|uniref:hypothetical protein n=1 Tax=Streptomyces sp. NPDC005805 TaxID=3157068 RepID=UPI0033F2E953